MTMNFAPEVVVPGSAADPFTAANGDEPNGNAGVPPNPDGAGASPNGSDATQTPNNQTPAPTVLTMEQVEALLNGKLSEATKGLERRISLQAKDLQAERERNAALQTEMTTKVRQAQLDQTPAHLREQQLAAWQQEDRVKALEAREGAALDLYRATRGTIILQEYGQYGLTEDELLACSTVEAMESLAKDKALTFFREGKGTKAELTEAKAAANSTPGAGLQADIGGSGGNQTQAPKFLTTTGVQSMADNISSMFNDGGPNRPW